MVMKHLIGKAPKIMKWAAKSPLGLAAEVVLVMSIIVLVFFSRASSTAKFISFGFLSVAVMLFSLAMARADGARAANSGEDPNMPRTMREPREVAATQAAAICFRRRGEKLEFLLIRSGKGTRRIFPKGNVKEGEAPWSTAEREAKEEAGVEGQIRREPLTSYWHRQGGKHRQEWSTAAFLLEVTRKTPDHELNRDPKWYTPQEAEEAVAKNRDPKDAKELQRVIRMATAAL